MIAKFKEGRQVLCESPLLVSRDLPSLGDTISVPGSRRKRYVYGIHRRYAKARGGGLRIYLASVDIMVGDVPKEQ